MLSVLYQFNEKYVPYAGTSIVSLLENNRDIDDITVYLLGEKVTEASKKKLVSQINIYGRNVVFIDSSFLIIRMKKLGINDYRGSYATNMKMFVSDFISENVERLLYVDCDTVIEGSLKALDSFDMKGNPIAMVLDSMCGSHKQSIGFEKEDVYFNGGVILYDMKVWRQERCTERICQHLENVRNHYMAPDQDIINIVLKGEITRLGVKYNIQPLHVVYEYEQYKRYFGQPGYYTKCEVKEALEKPIIVHFFRYLGEFPWHLNSLHPDTKQFDFYLQKSLWNDYMKKPTELNNFVFRMERWLYRILPRNIFILIFKVNYELFMWKSNKDSAKENSLRK